jgi:hypothetical protein
MKRAALSLVTVVAVVLACGAASCAPEDVVVADLPAHLDGGSVHHCFDDEDCHGNAFCAHASCDAPDGHCQMRPPFCDSARQVVCGCDGVTYWNDCLRRLAGTTLSTADYCATPATCDAAHACPSGAWCAHLVPSSGRCDQDDVGMCWVLPPTCAPDDVRWQACSGASECVDTCTAIRSGLPYHQPHGPCPG